MEVICLDTNVLIEVLKNNSQTIEQVSSFKQPLAISSITAMELIIGARNKKESKQIEQFIANFEMLLINENISTISNKLIVSFAKSHTLDIPDALIAASCLHYNCQLFTYNTKDFQFIPKLKLI